MTHTSNLQPDTLSGWLSYLEKIHPTNIDMGLERVQRVYQKLSIRFSGSQVILVAGTNGKGSTCRVLETLAQTSGLTTAVYSSPHIIDYRERVRVNGEMLTEQQHCNAFQKVEQARDDISLTYFEFGTLAALTLIADAQPDVVILEVGLGGRLDAVNIVEPDISVITTIDIDHQDWLGNTRDAVAYEKAGIMRSGKPCVVGDMDPPATLVAEVERINAQVYWQTRQFGYEMLLAEQGQQSQEWQYFWRGKGDNIVMRLPVPKLPVQNCATAISVARLCEWPVGEQLIQSVVETVSLPGRFECILSEPTLILDVAHNPEATGLLASRLRCLPYQHLHFVVGMLSDKDSKNSLSQLTGLSARWYLAPLNTPRSAKVEMLESALGGCEDVNCYQNIKEAYEVAVKNANPGDLIVGFGSFFAVSEIKQALSDRIW